MITTGAIRDYYRVREVKIREVKILSTNATDFKVVDNLWKIRVREA